MEELKFYVIRIRLPEDSTYWSGTDDDGDYNTAEYALEHGATMATNLSEMVADIIGSRGEYLDWIPLEMDELFAEEWVINDEDCISEIEMQDFGFSIVNVTVELSPNRWENSNGEWQIVS
ncbi:hypothetical protein ACFL67_00980 [candidate division KSB1 bacterium]